MATQPVFDLLDTYVHLDDGPDATPVEVGPDFWAKIAGRTDLHGGRLVTLFRFRSTADWDHWEMHPAGDEILYLLSGAIDLVLQEGDRERVVELRERGGCIIPRGTWHRGIVHRPSEALLITRGAGTEHRPV